jgi:hemerythrin
VDLLEWRDEFRIGIPEVDHEHRELIGLINALHGRLSDAASTGEIGEFLGELHAQISAHFALEEKVMRSMRYAEFDDHKRDHERLLDEIRDIMDGYELHSRYDARALSEVLDRWFSEHFRTRDARLHAAHAGRR